MRLFKRLAASLGLGADQAVAATAEAAERRRDIRHDHEGRTVSLAVADHSPEPMRVCNLSVRGASGEILSIPQAGQTVVVEFETGLLVSGIIRSVVGQRIGIEFFECVPLDVVEGDALWRTPGRRRRYPRQSLVCQVMLLTDGRRFDASVRNISRGGIQIEADCPLVPGQQVTLEWRGAEALHGHVRWSAGGKAGIMFAVPASLGSVQHWQDASPFAEQSRQFATGGR